MASMMRCCLGVEMSDEKRVERGPDCCPVTSPPHDCALSGLQEVSLCIDGAHVAYSGDGPLARLLERDVLAIAHRCSNWDALCDERDALLAENAKLNQGLVMMRAEVERLKRERDGMYVHTLPVGVRGRDEAKVTITPTGHDGGAPVKSVFVRGKNVFVNGGDD